MQTARHGDRWLRRMGIYLLHFLIGCVGVFIFGILLALLVHRVFSEAVSNAIFGGPVFFGQIGLGFLAGFGLNRSLRSRSAMWVWVLPTLWLIANIPDAFGNLYGPNGWGLLFGTKCGGDCLDQVLTVCPFYASVAYSVGSWAALGSPPEDRRSAASESDKGTILWWWRQISGIFLYSCAVTVGALIVTFCVALPAMLISHSLGMIVREAFSGPYYFGQALVALIGGFLVNAQLKSKVALAVWVFPTIWLVILIIDRVNSEAWRQLYGTCPFVTCAAYSLGAFVALRLHASGSSKVPKTLAP